MPKIKQDLFFDARVAGVSFKNKDGSSRQKVIPDIPPDAPLTLKREPDNKFDANAVAVLFGKKQIGYIPREGAEILAPIMDSGAAVSCVSTSVGQAQGGKKLWGCGIRVTWKEQA